MIAFLTVPPVCRAESTGEFLLFPQVDLIQRAGLNSNTTIDQDDQEASADIFMTVEVSKFRFLGEFLLTSEEQEFERFQLGWSHKNQLFWLGLFHNPIGYWNTSYHHGANLQTSISRPAIIEFEDRGGILPTHQAGLLVEGEFDLSGKKLGYEFALGSGPEFDPELTHWEVLNPGKRFGNTSATLNLYHYYDTQTPDTVGLFVNYSQISATTIGVDEIQQISAGLYGNWEFSRWRWLGASFYIHNQLERLNDGSETGAFVNAYVQTEYSLDSRWTLYGRIEQTLGGGDDAFLALFPEFTLDRALSGVRYDFANSNALKIEISTNHVREDHFTQLMLQWSAMF